jgi:hypothetical protein
VPLTLNPSPRTRNWEGKASAGRGKGVPLTLNPSPRAVNWEYHGWNTGFQILAKPG